MREALNAWAREGGVIRLADLSRDREGMALRCALRRHYASEADALNALGFTAAPPPTSSVAGKRPRRQRSTTLHYWTPIDIRRGLTQFVDSNGVLHPGRMQIENQALFEACRKRYGSVWAAAERLGIECRPGKHPSWTEEALIAAIRERADKHLSLSSNVVRVEDPALYGAAARLCGNWGQALRAAGCARSADVEPSFTELVAQVQAHRAGGGGALPHSLRSAILRGFPNVEAFYRAAGLSLQWTPQKVLEEIRSWSAPVSAKEIRRQRPGMYFHALQYFGSWKGALQQALQSQSSAQVRRPQDERDLRSNP